MPTADHINNVDQTDFAYARHVHASLGIEFPLVMRDAFWLDRWDGQFTVLLIATRELLSFEQGCNAGTAG